MTLNQRLTTLLCATAVFTLSACTQETQNRLGRTMQNWTGTDGVLEIYNGGKLVRRFMKIDKISTGTGTDNGVSRPYRFGYGILDANLDGTADKSEGDKVYFEFSDYSTQYVFYASPNT
ncbi:MAG: hypothetical protein ACPGSC_08175 [Granulosicoccaceae bacterium]